MIHKRSSQEDEGSDESSADRGTAMDSGTALFVAFLEEHANSDAEHQDQAFEALCRAHSSRAVELHRLRDHWLGAASVLDRLLSSRRMWEGGEEEDLPAKDDSIELDPQALHDRPSLQGHSRAEKTDPAKLFRVLRSGRRDFGRYVVREEIARGGMGQVLRVFDRDLRRHVALKVIRDKDARSEKEGLERAVATDPQSLGRFLEEAQITSQLAHPAIVPVHELGLDPRGRAYFTMKLVKGHTFNEVIRWVWDGVEDWPQTRAISALIAVCDALSFAHSKGVIHRDVKPSNVMVGRFGEVYLMDWGLARVLGRPERRDVRIQLESMAPASASDTANSRENERHDSPLLTAEGSILGTPAYMSPEQALGQIEDMGAHSDVYGVGAMLYHLLTAQPPYVPPRSRLTNRMVLSAAQIGPPRPCHEINPSVPPELEAICDKAMAREIEDRYQDTQELVSDLRAFLDNRVVAAHRTGPLIELRKWTERNRALAVTLGLLVVLMATCSLAISTVMVLKNRELRAKEAATQLLGDLRLCNRLVERANTLWPARISNETRFDEWLADADLLAARLEVFRAARDTARSRASDSPQSELLAGVVLQFPTEADGYLFEALNDLVRKIEALLAPLDCPADLRSTEDHQRSDTWLPDSPSIAGIRNRREHARWVQRVSIADWTRQWNEARMRVAGDYRFPGVLLTPLAGLLPLGPDPVTGFEEFWSIETGARPLRDETSGRWRIEEETGMVLVLLPPGSYWMGAVREATAPGQGNIDPHARPSESPVRFVPLAAFLVSKYEMTQGQYYRVTGERPSNWIAGNPRCSVDLTHPVESVTYDQFCAVARRFEIEVPTECQWEYLARAGTRSPWTIDVANENDPRIGTIANVADEALLEFRNYENTLPTQQWRDGFPVTASVGSLAPNDFGLYDVLGNVSEICKDPFRSDSYSFPVRAGDGLRLLGEVSGVDVSNRVVRGGAYNYPAIFARCASRERPGEGIVPKNPNIGFRPVRNLQPAE